MNVITSLKSGSPENSIEVVERKGRGHPDTICDAVSEEVSRSLSEYYLQKFGAVLHHNVDKVLLYGGSAESVFGGGKVLEPCRMFIAGRATKSFGEEEIPILEIAHDTAQKWFKQNMHMFNPVEHIVIEPLLRPGSAFLSEVFDRDGDTLANDTSCGVGYAPLSRLEQLVIDIEQNFLRKAHSDWPDVGEDIKVMGFRHKDRIELILACGIVDAYCRNIHQHGEIKDKYCCEIQRMANDAGFDDVVVHVNAADSPDTGSVYTTVTGTSAESGDDGQTGRGNRANGVISPMRITTLEALAGKNPTTHVGKLYNICATFIAGEVFREIEEVIEAECLLVSRIGQDIATPGIVNVRVRLKEGNITDIEGRIMEIVRKNLSKIYDYSKNIINREIKFDQPPLQMI